MFLYLPVENEVRSPYIGLYRTFGLRVLRSEKNIDTEVMTLPDISTDFDFTLR